MIAMDTDGWDGLRRTDDPAHGLGPTRARVLALLQDATEPMTAAAVGARLGLHVNSARFHLDALAEDRLVVREREERSTPGRPKVLYAAADAAPAAAHRSYRLLAEILTGVLADRLPEPSATAEAAGTAWGRFLTPPTPPFQRTEPAAALEVLVASLDAVGFDSHVVDEPDDLRLEVSHCPFLEVAERHHDVVCAVHLGLIRGVLEQTGAGVRATALEPLVEPSRCIAHLAADRG
ncbi:helix-turn-helix transcriptional regulator [Nocardioides sp.]|uniref:helix-turn-helix transcriptional regulator n=1 Tax=Nocardioides sp. TaxID=35761 RepID=UPI002ED98B30